MNQEDIINKETIKEWVKETYGEDMMLRDRAFCLAIEALETVGISIEDDPEEMARTLIIISNRIYNFLKGQDQS